MAAMSEEEQAQSRMKDLGGRSKNKKKYFEGQNSEECLQKLAMAAVRKEKERETHEIMESLPQAIENDTNEEVPGPSNIVKEKIDEKKTFQCTDCQKDFANKANLKRHQSTHTKKKCFQCKSCGYATDQKANLHKHEQRRHSQDTQNTFQCSDSDCNKSFKSSSAREKHEKHHEKKFVCKICDKRFPYECRLKEHEKTHLDNEDMPHQCETCEWGFAKKDNFKKHQVTINHMRRAIEQEIRIESEEDSAEESEIVSIWNPPADIERREPMYIEVLSGNLGIFAKDKPNKRPCSESSDTSLDTPKESKSREIQKNPEDSTSERSTKTQDILTSKKEKGIQRKKNCSGTSDGNREESVVEKAKRDKQKEECVERHNFDWFTKEREKQMERQSSFPIASSSVSSQTQGGSCQTTMEPTVPKIRCPVGCKKKFSSSKELTKHLRLENDIMGKTFNCQFCEKKFTRCNDKSAHETRHREEEKPFQCRYFNCLERFSTNQERDSHYEAHFQPSNL